MTFVLKKLAQILPTSETCYLVECGGERCIIDEYKSPGDGSRVMLEISGNYEWGTVLINPWRIVTDSGQALAEDIRIVGVVTHEIKRISDIPHRAALPESV